MHSIRSIQIMRRCFKLCIRLCLLLILHSHRKQKNNTPIRTILNIRENGVAINWHGMTRPGPGTVCIRHTYTHIYMFFLLYIMISNLPIEIFHTISLSNFVWHVFDYQYIVCPEMCVCVRYFIVLCVANNRTLGYFECLSLCLFAHVRANFILGAIRNNNRKTNEKQLIVDSTKLP